MKFMLCVVSFAIVLTLSGCSYLTRPMEQPVIEDHSIDNRIATFATIPSRRVIIMKAEDLQASGTDSQNDNRTIIVCAEPPADVSDNIAGAFGSALTATLPATGSPPAASIAANMSESRATAAKYLIQRTQGLQLYRDGMYNLCQAKMNKIIDDETFIARADKLLEVSAALIKAEIELPSYTPPRESVDAPAPAPPDVSANTTESGNTSTIIGNPGTTNNEHTDTNIGNTGGGS